MEKLLSSARLTKGELVYFGYGKYSASMNMAIDDVLFHAAAIEKKFFIRFYDFTRPTVILASSDSYTNFIGKEGDGIDVTRRMSGGKPIYIDDNVLSYCITGPISSANPRISAPTSIHGHFGEIVARSIADTIHKGDIELGKAYSIRVDGKPIAGHGQHLINNSAFLYHGVIAIGPWDTERIGRNIKLRKEDIEALRTLPNLHALLNGSAIGSCKSELMAKVLSGMRSDFEKNSEIGAQPKAAILERAEVLSKSVYGSATWVHRDDIKLKEDSRFCLLWEG